MRLLRVLPLLSPWCLSILAAACGSAPGPATAPSPTMTAEPAPSPSFTADAVTSLTGDAKPPKPECEAFMDIVARTTAVRAKIQTQPSSATIAAGWADETAVLAAAAKKLDLSQPELIAENAGLATRLGDLTKDLRALAEAEKSADPKGLAAARARVLNTSEQVEVISREPVARCGGDPKKLRPTPGRLEPAKIQAVVRARFGDYRKCYEEGLRRDPKLSGRVTLRFTIGRDGAVVSAQSDDSPTLPADAIAPPSAATTPPMKDAKVIDCALAITKTLVFPKPEGGAVVVVYPISFTASE